MKTTNPSILKSLRSLVPLRDCEPDEALVVAERQATRLLALVRELDPSCEGIDLVHLDALPRIRVVFESLPVSGMSHWNGHEWVITIAKGDGPARQRFTLLHEFKHVIDHGYTDYLYSGGRSSSHPASFRGRSADRGFTPRSSGGVSPSLELAERAADYFAGCALVPKAALKRVWGLGLQRPELLADHFGVSEAAIRVRLSQTGLDRPFDREPSPRCARPVRTPRLQPQRFAVRGPHRRSSNTPFTYLRSPARSYA